MTTGNNLRIGLGVVLNAADLLIAFFLILGGWNAVVVNPLVGYGSMLSGILLLYLSSGVWIGGEWKINFRLALYGSAAAIVLVSAASAVVRGGVRAQSPAWVAVCLIFVILILSILHLRLSVQNRRRLANPPASTHEFDQRR